MRPSGIVRNNDVSREDSGATLQRILQSSAFASSKSLRQILEFLVTNDSAPSPETVKEYSIATEVLGRPKDFDPKTDNIVRVQIHRLRERLEEYYQGEGRNEQLRISIPRGHYTPAYARAESIDPGSNIESSSETAYRSRKNSGRLGARWVVLFFLLATNLILLTALFRRSKAAAPVDSSLPASLRSLWQPFIASATPPLIVFANPAFLVDDLGNLYRYQSPTVLSMPMGTRLPKMTGDEGVIGGQKPAGPFYYFDSYTGTGELVAASRIAQFLTSHGKNFAIERSRVASYDDIKSGNVVFLGGDKEDRLLRNLPVAGEFTFQPPPPHQYPTGSYIKDAHPARGRPSTYGLQLDPSTGAIQVDYALISLLPNVTAGHYVLDLGGITTLGTEAAAAFATSPQDMLLLQKMRSAAKTGTTRTRFFQVLIRVRIRDGVTVGSECVAVRDLPYSGP